MKNIKVAAAALNQTPLDWRANLQHHIDAIKEARSQDVSIVVFPELSITGYGCEDQFLSLDVCRRAREVLLELVPHTKDLVVCAGLPLLYNDHVFNGVCLMVDGRIEGFVAKQHLANDLIYYEARWFKRWKTGVRSTVIIDGSEYPIGDLLFEIDGYKLAFEICEDAWVANRPAILHGSHGVNIILNPSASHFAFGRNAIRRQLIQESSRTTGAVYIYSNYLGLHSGRILYDGRCYVASCGTITAASPRFSFNPWELLTATVDLDESRYLHSRSASAEVSFEGAAKKVLVTDYSFKAAKPALPEFKLADWEKTENLEHEEFARGGALALFDYLRKSRQKRFVVSLSGGKDSSSVACLVRLMIHLGIQQLGLNNFKNKLAYNSDLASIADEKALTSYFLSCIYQRSKRNSSKETEAAARSLASDLGASFYLWDIDELVDLYEATVGKALGLTLSWEEHDLARQNIQARVRAPGAWMVANLLEGLLLTTSNRSEASVGYATMDGDTSGGWNPIGGVDKPFLTGWLNWLEQQGVHGTSLRFKGLKPVNEQQPSAELRSGGTQRDETDLMPYPILDFIERTAISRKFGPSDSFELLKISYGHEYSDSELFQFIERFYRKWSINQWKRERLAPALFMDNQNLDPKTACRFPILSGGYIQELKELKERIISAKN